MVKTALPLPRVLALVRVNAHAPPVAHVALKAALVLLARRQRKYADALSLPVFAVAEVDVTVRLAKATKAVILALEKLAVVNVAVGRCKAANTRDPPVEPVALVHLAVRMGQRTPTVAQAIGPLPDKLLARRRTEDPQPIAHAPLPVADVSVAIGVRKHGVAIVIDATVVRVVVVHHAVQLRARLIDLRLPAVPRRVELADDLDRRRPDVRVVKGACLATRTRVPIARRQCLRAHFDRVFLPAARPAEHDELGGVA
mmetsp:Transcript_73570/g.209496  ORF Transcript_73570/g.209496 Transcript_73570/m.209496 type:complete len:256 (-) Transcript_73570:1068-1835(-)